jgi:nicotinamide phosphoribosyltransferase
MNIFSKFAARAVSYIDGYKYDHRRQYPALIERVLANWTPRGSRIPGVDKVAFVGLQLFLRKRLMDELQQNFFGKPVDEVCAAYERRVNRYLGPNAIGSEHIRAWHKLGFTPLIFKALPEGTQTPVRVPMFTVENTPGHEAFYWLVNYYETLLSCSLWLACTSATSALRLRRLLEHAAIATGTPLEFVDYQAHDFSMRGMGSLESAELSGIGHLVAFKGTDTVPAIDVIEDYYGNPLWDDPKEFPIPYTIGVSVPATEHSVVCAGGKMNEKQTIEHLLDLYPTGIVSSVSDTWDLWNMLTVILPSLKDRIMSRDGKFVVRPDSGDPVKIVCGDPNATPGSPQYKGVIELLWDTFGGTITPTGHRMLDSHVGCIYGDAINYPRAEAILAGLAAKGFASGNIVFGVGSFTYQYVTRDVFNFAMKSTWAQIGGIGYDLFKQPVTDDGMKNSAKGRLAVQRPAGGELVLVNEATPEQEAASQLQSVWADGQFIRTQTWEQVRHTALTT